MHDRTASRPSAYKDLLDQAVGKGPGAPDPGALTEMQDTMAILPDNLTQEARHLERCDSVFVGP